MKKLKTFLVMMSPILFFTLAYAYLTKPEYYDTHQWDSANQRWINIHWKVITHKTPTNFEAEWQSIDFDYSTDPHKYPMDCPTWGLVNNVQEFNSLVEKPNGTPSDSSVPPHFIESRVHQTPECVEIWQQKLDNDRKAKESL